MLVLALDTSTSVLTAGVVELDETAGEPTLLATESLTDPFAHAEQLMPLLKRALATAGRRLPDANGVVVGLGPGPFTGLRVGIASAAALGDALEIPVYGVGSHAGFAAGSIGELLVVTDARRKEVYVSAVRDGRVVAGPEPVAPAALADWLAAHDVAPGGLLGPGAGLVADLVLLPIRDVAVPLAVGLVTAARDAVLSGAVPAPLTPLYLRRPDATEPSATRKSVLGR